MNILHLFGGRRELTLTYRELSADMQVRFGSDGFLETDAAISDLQAEVLQREWARCSFACAGDGDRFLLTKDGLKRLEH